MNKCTCLRRPKVNSNVFPSCSPPYFLKQGLSLNLKLVNWPCCLTSRLQGSSCLCLTNTGFAGSVVGDPHWGHHHCLASTLLMTPSSQPPTTAFSHFLPSLDFTIAKVTPWRKALGTCSSVRQEAVLVTYSKCFPSRYQSGKGEGCWRCTSGPGSCGLLVSTSSQLLKLLAHAWPSVSFSHFTLATYFPNSLSLPLSCNFNLMIW